MMLAKPSIMSEGKNEAFASDGASNNGKKRAGMESVFMIFDRKWLIIELRRPCMPPNN
jgi:hypothetical protein